MTAVPFLDSRPDVFIGVDGGGSTCRARVRDGEGRVSGGAVGGAANVYLAFDAAIATIEATLHAALKPSGLDQSAFHLRICVGLAGVSSPAVAQRVTTALAGWGHVAVTSDADIACAGAHAGGDGGLVIAGTGSGAVARLGGAPFTIGGRGFLLGDDGSGARIGLDALRLALRAHDGLVAHTPLTRQLMATFADDPVAAITWGRTAPSSAFAALAPVVLAAATSGDPAGRAVVADAANALAGLVDALLRRGVPRLSFVGGLAEAMRAFLPAGVTDHLAPSLLDALDGALLLAGCPIVTGPQA